MPFDTFNLECDDVRGVFVPFTLGGESLTAVVRSRVEPLGHGMGDADKAAHFEEFLERLYICPGLSQPYVYDGEELMLAGLRRPPPTLSSSAIRRTVREKHTGAVFYQSSAILSSVGGQAQLSMITSPDWDPSASDVGKLVVIPSEREFNGGGTADGPDYAGVITSVEWSGTDHLVKMLPDLVAGQAAAIAVRVFVFETEQPEDEVPITAQTWKSALETIEASNSYGEKRPVPNGGVDIVADAQGENSGAAEKEQALRADGNTYIRVRGVDLEEEDDVLHFKCILRCDSLDTSGGGVIPLWVRRNSEGRATFELAVVDEGRIRFRFYDTKLEDFREATSEGRCLSLGETYHVEFRYRYKVSGGWEPDFRWMFRDNDSREKKRLHRDFFGVWALEGKNPADPLLVIPGCHNGFDGGTKALVRGKNTSQAVGNVGMLATKPEIGFEPGDPNWPGGLVSWAGEEPPRLIEVLRDSGSGGDLRCRMIAADNVFLPRWFSLNRDVALHDAGTKDQISELANNFWPNLGATAGGIVQGRAVLCKIYAARTVAGSVWGELPSGTRTFVVRDVDDTDLGSNSPAGANNSFFNLIDTVGYGADGLGSQDVGPTFDRFLIAFALPNGSNHAAGAKGNTAPLPTLLRMGERPLGTDDTPDRGGDDMFLFGAPKEFTVGNQVNFRGVVEEVGISVRPVQRSSNDVYTDDHMAPDCQYTGPIDIRVHSLPGLEFREQGALQQYVDIGGQSHTNATWASRFSGENLRNMRSDVGARLEGSAGIEEFEPSSLSPGVHRVSVTFYDPVSGVESPASEERVVNVEVDEDDPDPDARRQILLENLPISDDPRHHPIHRRVWKSTVDGATFYLASVVRDNRTTRLELSTNDEELVAAGVQLDRNTDEPPVCGVLRASERNMWYADILEAPNAVQVSRTFRPWLVDNEQREILESGEGNPVTALAHVDGRMVAFRRDSYYLLGYDGLNVFARRMQSNTGAVSHGSVAQWQDSVIFVAEKGVHSLDGTSRMVYLSPLLEGFFAQIDKRTLHRVQAVYDRRRNQYLFTAQLSLAYRAQHLVSGEFPDSPFAEAPGWPIWSIGYYAEGISALSIVSEEETDDEVVLQGTPHGFVGRLFVGNALRGHIDNAAHGLNVTSVVSVGADRLELADAVDMTEDGLSGIPFVVTRTVQQVDGHGAYEAFVHQGAIYRIEEEAGLTYLRFMEAVSGIAIDDKVYLGGWRTFWQSRWFDHRRFTREGRVTYLEAIFNKEAGGKIVLEVWRDFGDTPTTTFIPMDDGYAIVEIHGFERFWRFRVARYGSNAPVAIHAMALRHEAMLEGMR